MILKRRFALSGALLFSVLLARADAAQQQTLGGWTFTVAPYVWLSEVHGSAQVRNLSANIDVTFSDIFNLMGDGDAIGGSGHFEGRYNKFITFLDVTGMFAKPGASGPRDAESELRTGLMILESVIGYRVFELPVGESRTLGVEPMFGVRYTYSRNTIEVNTAGNPLVPPRNVEADADYDLIDPFLGGRITLNLFDKLDWSFRGDAAPFKTGSDFAWNIVSVFRYELPWKICNTSSLHVAAGYRLLDFNKSNDAKSIDLQFRGPLAGLAIDF